MKKLLLTLILCLVWTGHTWGHGDRSELPNAAQIMQYRLLLYMTPDDPAPRNGLAMALYRTNKLEEAEGELRYILERDPLNFDALDGLGIVLIRMERYKEASEYLNKAVAIDEQDVMVHVHLSVLYEKMRLPEKAESELEKAKSLAAVTAELEKIDKELELVSGE
ncbi:MAG: hypothetical protein BA872_06745 [Desulfobacterales bacterium C00003060]|nr:MAG: hypothetical protein BA861_05435 [Desulfobacterales bacterium S3730MH5]OEU80357.1 MAG: hypothetical protein BA872_06745 [Desulfobacterales bacterium C00003060]OEU83115.1 MAG: hypothetical protein BA865_00300 [Desulfobacterales bacterium S5133MH4]